VHFRHQAFTGGARESKRRRHENQGVEGWGIRTGVPLHNRLRAGADPGVEIGEPYSKDIDLTGYWGDIKEDWWSGGPKFPSWVQGQRPGRELGDQKLNLFCETTHNNCIKIQQQQLLLLLDKINDITYKIFRGTCPTCPIGFDAPAI